MKCNPDDTIEDLKKLIAAQSLGHHWCDDCVDRCGTRWEKIRIQKWYNVYKDHITLEDYEIKDGMGWGLDMNLFKMMTIYSGLELYYN